MQPLKAYFYLGNRTSVNDINSKFYWKSTCYLNDRQKQVTLWKREDLHIPTRFTQIPRTLLLDAKVLRNPDDAGWGGNHPSVCGRVYCVRQGAFFATVRHLVKHFCPRESR